MKNQKNKKSKTPLIILVVAVLAFFVLVLALGGDSSDDSTAETTTTKAETTEAETTEAVPQREEAIGKSDKSIADFPEKITLSPMRNDATGNWKLARIATSETIEEYAISYYNEYFEKKASNETHWIVNFTNHTTTSINYQSGLLFVNTYEYVDGEEHDAHDIGAGMPLTSFIIYTDNGDIEKNS